MRTSFDKIATECRKISKCLRCWDGMLHNVEDKEEKEGMYIEVELDNPYTNKCNDYLIAMAKTIATRYPDVKIEKEFYSSGSSYDTHIIQLSMPLVDD